MNTNRSLVLACALALPLVACQDDGVAERDTAATTATPATNVPPPVTDTMATRPMQDTMATQTATRDARTPPLNQTDTTAQQAPTGEQHSATGTITALNAEQGNVTVAHEPVETLDWPAMTMSFRVEDPAVLQDLEVGDEVEFLFVQQGDGYVIRQLQDS